MQLQQSLPWPLFLPIYHITDTSPISSPSLLHHFQYVTHLSNPSYRWKMTATAFLCFVESLRRKGSNPKSHEVLHGETACGTYGWTNFSCWQSLFSKEMSMTFSHCHFTYSALQVLQLLQSHYVTTFRFLRFLPVVRISMVCQMSWCPSTIKTSLHCSQQKQETARIQHCKAQL